MSRHEIGFTYFILEASIAQCVKTFIAWVLLVLAFSSCGTVRIQQMQGSHWLPRHCRGDLREAVQALHAPAYGGLMCQTGFMEGHSILAVIPRPNQHAGRC